LSREHTREGVGKPRRHRRRRREQPQAGRAEERRATPNPAKGGTDPAMERTDLATSGRQRPRRRRGDLGNGAEGERKAEGERG